MYKTVLHDYRYHRKDGFRNLLSIPGIWFVYLYPLWFLPAVSDMGFREAAVFFSAMVPVLFSLMFSRMYGGQIGKTLFLCPMSKEDRRAYVKAGMRIRIGFCVGLFLVLHSVLAALGWITLPMFAAKLTVMILSAVSVNIYCQPDHKGDDGTKRSYPLRGNYAVWDMLAQIMCIVNMVLLSMYEGNERLWELILTAALILFQFAVCMELVCKFYPQVLEHTVCYESGWKEENKK